jgi:hypothetical protein
MHRLSLSGLLGFTCIFSVVNVTQAKKCTLKGIGIEGEAHTIGYQKIPTGCIMYKQDMMKLTGCTEIDRLCFYKCHDCDQESFAKAVASLRVIYGPVIGDNVQKSMDSPYKKPGQRSEDFDKRAWTSLHLLDTGWLREGGTAFTLLLTCSKLTDFTSLAPLSNLKTDLIGGLRIDTMTKLETLDGIVAVWYYSSRSSNLRPPASGLEGIGKVSRLLTVYHNVNLKHVMALEGTC